MKWIGDRYFWGCNLILAGIALFGMIPWVGEMLSGSMPGEIPLERVVCGLLLIFTPFAAMMLAVTYCLQSLRNLFILFYCIEIPLFLLVLFRLFVMGQLTYGIAFIFITFLCAIFGCLWAFLEKSNGGKDLLGNRVPALIKEHLYLGISTVSFIAALYIGAISIFYIPMVVDWVFPDYFHHVTGHILLFFAGAFLFALLIAFLLLFVPSPFYLLCFSFSNWFESFNRLFKEKPLAAGGNLVVVVGVWIGLFSLSLAQPHEGIEKKLASPPKTIEELATFSKHAERIRLGLVNQYLYQYRYWTSKEESADIRVAYEEYFDIDYDTAQFFQNQFNALLAPILYNGKYDDIEQARKMYAQIFDNQIEKGELAAVRNAIGASPNGRTIHANILDTEQKRVLVTERALWVKEHGYYADIKLFERYKNKTNRQQEIVYYLTVPQGAVITGLKMGLTPDESSAFDCVIAPRGAAQQVYNREVRQQRDPALLEQVGPTEYRLRVFPIPGKWDRAGDKPTRGELCLWMTVQALKTSKGFPVPRLLEKRNVYWTMANETAATDKDGWFTEFIEPENQDDNREHTIVLPEGYQVSIRPRMPVSSNSIKKVAVVLDSSYSMKDYIQAAFEKAKDGFEGLDKDVYVISKVPEQNTRINVAESDVPLCYGSLTQSELLNEFDRMREGEKYDAVFVLTDAGSYELESNTNPVFGIEAPVWMVHLGARPKAYADTVIDVLYRGGGAIIDSSATMKTSEYIAYAEKKKKGVTQGEKYEWAVSKTKADESEHGGAQQLAASMVIADKIRTDQVVDLDQLHAIAGKYGVVTPYSSMLVLVNDVQRMRLKTAEKGEGRFERRIDTDENLIAKSKRRSSLSSGLSAVPEPHEWVLICVGIALLIFLWSRERFSFCK